MPGLLCILAHPDDETFCAGLLLALKVKNIPLQLLCVTRGEGGSLGAPALTTRAELGTVREKEMRCAAEVFGAQSLAFLDYVDPVGDQGLRTPDHDPETFSRDLRAAIDSVQPSAVLTHGSGGEYGHPAHRWVHRAVKSVVAAIGEEAPALYSFNASHARPGRPKTINYDDPAAFIIDTGMYNAGKVNALTCHATQWMVFVGAHATMAAYETPIARFVEAAPREAYCRHWPPNKAIPDDLMASWLGVKPLSPRMAHMLSRVRKLTYKITRRLQRYMGQ